MIAIDGGFDSGGAIGTSRTSGTRTSSEYTIAPAHAQTAQIAPITLTELTPKSFCGALVVDR
jgi:hypothetical protein